MENHLATESSVAIANAGFTELSALFSANADEVKQFDCSAAAKGRIEEVVNAKSTG